MNIWSRDDDNDEFDGWEGDALGTLDLVGGEVDWSELNTYDPDFPDDEEEDECEDDDEDCDCLKSGDGQECVRCFHTTKCGAEPCSNIEHRLTLRQDQERKLRLFGNPDECLCSRLVDVPICIACDHKEECNDLRLVVCPDEDHAINAIIARDGCGCAALTPIEASVCGLCNHDELCDQAKGCEQGSFHDFIPVGTVRCACGLGKAKHCPTCGHIENCRHRDACSEWGFHFPDELAVEAPRPFDALPARDVSSGLPARHKAYWTRAEDEQLIGLLQAGLDFVGIAKEHGRTQRSIATRLTRLCFEENGVLIKSDPIKAEKAKEAWTEEDDDLLTTLHVNKLGLALLSAALKRSQKAVAIRLIHLRLVSPCNLDKITYYSESDSSESSFRNARWTTPQYVEVREAFRQGSTLTDLATISGRSEGSCLMVLYARGEITVEDLQQAVESAQASIPKD